MQNDMILISNDRRMYMAGNYYTPFSLRISESLLDQIKEIAKANKRSANKEIEYALEQYAAQYSVKADKTKQE